MTCTEYILAKSPEPTTREELEKLPAYKECMKILDNQPGYIGLTSGVVKADPTLIVWLVEWETMEDHTEKFTKSDSFQPFIKQLTSFLDPNKPILAENHYASDPRPSQAFTSQYPVLEILIVTLKEPSDTERIVQVFKPDTDKWTQEGRKWSYAPALDKDVGKLMFVVPWASVEEHHKAAGKMQESVNKAKEIWGEIEFIGYISP